MCLRARIRSFKPPELHFLSFYHNLKVDKDCLVTQLCLFCIVTSLKILASYTLLPLLMYSCKFQLRNSIFIILYTITCALNDQSCRCAIKQHSFIHSKLKEFADDNFKFDENGRKLSKRVENTVGKGEIARHEQFLLFPQCFQKACFPGASKGVIVWEWVIPL